MNAPIKRLRSVAHDRQKFEALLLSIELAFEVKDRALKHAKSVLQTGMGHHNTPVPGSGKTIGEVIDDALKPWSHNTDEVKP